MNKTLLSLAVLAILSGCSTFSTPPYECGLDDNPQAKCASMEQSYAAAKRIDPKAKSTSVFGTRASTETREDSKPFFQGKESEFPETGQQGMPVFSQPKVHRVWVAPYVDADGNLRTGEYTYFNTAGKWNYGSTKTPGSASGVFGPSKPGNLGFNPVDAKKVAPAAVSAPPKPANTPAATAASTKAMTDNITQPYQKLID